MKSFNYFQFIYFLWAAIGIGSRIIMLFMKQRWKEWELNSAYKINKPKWVNIVGISGYLLVFYTWYQVIVNNIKYSWIIALLITFTILKVSALLFNYEKFRKFAVIMLNNKKKMSILNSFIIILSIVLILMGIFLY